MNKFELFVALVLVVAFFAGDTSASEDVCPEELEPCVKLWKERDLCANLEPICQAILANNASYVNDFSKEKCENGSEFSPVINRCVPENSSYTITSKNHHLNESTSPWGVNCSVAGHKFCFNSMSCLAEDTCSLKALYDWQKAANTTYGPYGKVCYENQTYCVANLDCIPINTTCQVVYNATAFESFCPEEDLKYCGKRGVCINVNSTCDAFSALNLENATDPGLGWKQICEVRQSVCTRFAAGLAHCWPKIAHCAVNRSEPEPQPTSPPAQCNSNMTFCNGTGRCHHANETCCPAEQYECDPGSCIPFSNPCKQPVKAPPCPPSAEACQKLISDTSRFCEMRFEVCDALVNNATIFQEKLTHFNDEVCNGTEEFCPLSNGCHSSGTVCNLDTAAPLSGRNSTPWGDACPINQTFCGQAARCLEQGSACSARAVADWKTAGNTSVGPYGQVCGAGLNYCFDAQECYNSSSGSCAFDPENRDNDAAANSSHIYSRLCKEEDRHCVHSLHCGSINQSCSPFPALNYTGVNDTGSGWEVACKISNYRCQRLKYAVDKCYPLVRDCHLEKNLTKIKCFHPHFAYCQHLDRCINASHHCCPVNKTYCPDRNKCIKNGDRCPIEECEETPCANVLRISRQCGVLDKICPLLRSPPGTIASAYNKYHNRTDGTPCPENDQKFCPLKGRCTSDPCRLDMDEDRFEDEIPWGGKCANDTKFCRSTLSCVTDTKTCNFQMLKDWIQAGNLSHSPCGKMCSAGETFCLWSYSCINNTVNNCTLSPPLAFNHTLKNESTLDFMCGKHHRFCPKQFNCVRKTEACVDPPAVNFTGANDNGTGFLELCQIKDVYCRRVTYGILKCGASKKFSRCIKRKLERCAKGFTLCEKNGRCIGLSEYCLGPGECPPFQFRCPELGGCINKTIDCEIPQSQVIFKTAWFYNKLDEVRPTLFPSGNTIAITSVSETNGTVQYHDGSNWVSVTGIAPNTALVLGKTNMIRFVPGDRAFHGVVLFNYTVIAGTVGQKIDASSSNRALDDVIASVVLPVLRPPSLKEIGPPCQIHEDQRGGGFEMEDKIKLVFHNFSVENNIDFDVMANLKRSTVSAYRRYLELVNKAKPVVAIIYLEKDPKRGVFRFNATSRLNPIITDHLSTRLVFSPALHYHGGFNATFAAGLVFDDGSLNLDIPKLTDSILFTIFKEKNATDNQMKVFRGIMKNIKDSRVRPTKANLVNVMTKVDGEASGLNKTDIGKVKDWVSLAYDRAKLVNGGNDEAFSRFKPMKVMTREGPREFLFSDDVLYIKCKVLKVNDAPKLTSYIAYFPPIEYNITVTPNNGFPVSEITTRIPYPYGKVAPKFSKIAPLIIDVDGDVPGIGIVFAKNSSVGAYYYRDDANGAWQLVNLNNTLRSGKLVGESEVLLLKPSAELKFEMHDKDHLWSNTVARREANLLFAAWDQSDNKSNGVHKFDFPVSKNDSISKKFVSAFVSRKGCDGKPGSRGRVDVCGKCGGDGTWCRGCDGVAHSGAKFDHCDNCTGGTTGKTFNFRKDCGGGCGKSFMDNCNICQKYGREINFTDCSGTCQGGAKINRCGNCVGGQTGKAKTLGEDVCGVCGGSGNTCLDCASTPKGTKKNDFCGNCLEPTDSRFNSECVKLGNMDPISGDNSTSNEITLVGAGLKSYSTATCEFFNVAGVVKSLAAVNVGKKSFVITATAVPAGQYSLRCKFDSLSTFYPTINNFTFYDRTAISFAGITPNETEAGTGASNATITGTGFPDTGFVKCLSDRKLSWPAIYVSATEVKCLFGDRKKSLDMKLVPQFGANDKVVSVSAPRYQFYTVSPYPTAIQFVGNLQALVVTMNKPSKHKGKSCDELFTAGSVSRFGSRARCVLRRPDRLFVLLRGRPTIAPNHVVTFIDGVLTRKFEEVTKLMSGERNLTVQGPAKTVVPKVALSGPSKVGACGVVKLDASRSSGGGGRRLNFEWFAVWAASQDMSAVNANANATVDLDAINTLLSGLSNFAQRVKLTKSYLQLDLQYEVRVRVSNFLGETSENSTLIVVRENKQLPVINAGAPILEQFASRDLIIQAKAILSPCLDPNAVAAKVLFSWEINAVGIDLGITDKPRLRIEKQSLEGGKPYTLTVTAAMASDQTLSSTQEIVINVKSGKLVPGIRGGSYRVVGATDMLKLDASPSKDPDGSSESPWYKWECADSNGNPCFVPDPNNVGKQIRFVMPTEKKVVIDVAKNLVPNSKYTFTMTFNKGERKASKSVKIKVDPGSPPYIEIKPQVDAKENPSTITIVRAFVSSTMPTTNVKWECVQDDNYGFVDLSDPKVALTPLTFTMTRKAGKSKAVQNVALVLAAGTLPDGQQLKFMLTATHTDSTAVSETVITTNAAPSQGTLEVSPTNGTAVQTLFVLSADEDWSDDPDDMPLQYKFGYIFKGKDVPFGMFGGSNKREDIKFPPGDSENYTLTVFVDCMDALKAVTRQTTIITVMPMVMDDAFLGAESAKILDDFGSDWDKAMGSVGTILDSLPPGPPSPAVLAMKEGFADSTVDILQTGGVTVDIMAKLAVYGSLGSITKGGTSMKKESKKKIGDTIVEIETAVSKKRRKRRAAESPSSVTAISVDQAQTTLSLLSNLIDPSLFDSDTMSQKSSFLTVVDSTGQKVCAGLAVGMPASVVQDKLLVLRNEKNSFSDVATAYTEMACNDCPSSLAKTAKVQLGTTLQNTYASWNCSGGDNLCSGACLITSQQIYDLLSTSSLANTTLTSVVNIKLYNPETYAAISVSTLATPVSYHLPVLNVTVNNETYFECKRWDSSAWTKTGCETNHDFVVENGTTYVECKCTQIGYTAAFKATRPPPTEPPATTIAVPVTTTKPPVVKVRRVRMAIQGDFDTLLSTPAKTVQFKKDVANSLASTMNINASRIVNMTLTKGSIIVNFVLLPDASDSDASIAASLSKLETAVKGNLFTVTLNDGTVLKADPTSFSSTSGDAQPTAPTVTVVPATEKSGLTQTTIIIIGCVVGGLVLIILVIVIICCCKKKKERKVSPENSQVQLRGGVEMEERNKRDGNYNDAVQA